MEKIKREITRKEIVIATITGCLFLSLPLMVMIKTAIKYFVVYKTDIAIMDGWALIFMSIGDLLLMKSLIVQAVKDIRKAR